MSYEISLNLFFMVTILFDKQFKLTVITQVYRIKKKHILKFFHNLQVLEIIIQPPHASFHHLLLPDVVVL